MRAWSMLVLVAALGSSSCSLFTGELPEEPSPLADMEEPLPLLQEPDDERDREQLPAGSFTGIYVTDSRTSMDQLDEPPEGVLVERVIENSPADKAGIHEGDLLLEVSASEPVGKRQLGWPSEWRAVELVAKAGMQLHILLDRAGRDFETQLETVARVHPGAREDAERFREEQHVGVVLRTATEVEARAAGLGPGGGAVIVGLSRASPWRAAGLRFGDLLVEVDGRAVAHPQVVLDAIREASKRGKMKLVYARDGERHRARTAVTSRSGEMTELFLPPLLSYESERGRSETSVLLGLVYHETTAVAWRWRLLWLFSLGGGEADRLVEVDR